MTVTLPVITAALRLFGYGRTRRWLERLSESRMTRRATPKEIEMAERLARLAGIAGHHGPVTATCLRQSLLVYWLLRNRGLQPDLQIGVRKQGTDIQAHAWVELEGRALDQTEITHHPFT